MNNVPKHFVTNDITTVNFVQKSNFPSTLVIISHDGIRRMTAQLEGYSADDFSGFSFSLTEENLKIENGAIVGDFSEAIVQQNLNSFVRNTNTLAKNTTFGASLYTAAASGSCVGYVLTGDGSRISPYDFGGEPEPIEFHFDKGRTLRIQAFEDVESCIDVYCS